MPRFEWHGSASRTSIRCSKLSILAHRLLVNVETFTISSAEDGHPRVVVSADALDLTMPIWEYAVSTLDRMPFSTFLPANLAARRTSEDLPTAIRSIAWIAVDDALDAFNGSPDHWDPETRAVLLARLLVVELAVEQVARALDSTSAPRLIRVRSSIQELRGVIAKRAPSNPGALEPLPVVRGLRTQWARWGPVPRLPGIEGTGVIETVTEPRPALLLLGNRSRTGRFKLQAVASREGSL